MRTKNVPKNTESEGEFGGGDVFGFGGCGFDGDGSNFCHYFSMSIWWGWKKE